MSCSKNHYIIHTPYACVEHGNYNKEILTNNWIFLKGTGISEIISEFNLPINTAFSISSSSILDPCIDKISSENILKQTGYEYKISSLITDMLISIGRQYEFAQNTSHPAYTTIDSARKYMLNNIDKKISLDELAERTNYSKSHFCALYSKFFGSKPIDDLLSARIEKAVSLLEYSHMTVNEISSVCGFSSINYFSRKFKEKTGFSPTHYFKF